MEDTLKALTLLLAACVEAAAALVIGLAALEAAAKALFLFLPLRRPSEASDPKEILRLKLGRWLAVALELAIGRGHPANGCLTHLDGDRPARRYCGIADGIELLPATRDRPSGSSPRRKSHRCSCRSRFDQRIQTSQLELNPLFFEFLNSLSLTALFVVLTVAIIIAAELGRLIGVRVSERVKDKDASNMASAALGLLALLIAFTYSMAVSRYDLRRSVVLEEANAIGSTANFALMLPIERQAPALDLLRDYTKLRLNLGVPYDEQKFEADVKQGNAMLARLWQGAVADTAAAPQSLPVYRYVQSLNETNNVAEKRLTALRNHVPVVVLLMLTGTAIVAMAFTGYGAGVSGANRRIATAIMSVLLAFLIVMTQDLARPDRGAIQISTQALSDALTAISSSVGK